MDVGDLLELQRALQGDRVAEPPARVHEVAVLAVLVRDLLDLLLARDDAADLVRQEAKRLDQLLPALERNSSVDGREAQSEQVQADDVGEHRLGRRDSDFGSGVEIDRTVGVASGRACDHVGHRHAECAAGPRLLHRDERVGRLAGLADHDIERALAHRRAAIAELRRVLGPGGNAGPVLDDVLADHRRVERCAHAEQQDVMDLAELLVRDVELAEGDLAVVGEPATRRVGDRLGRLVDLFQHEVGEPALLRLRDVPVDVHDLGLHSHPV